MNNKPKCKCEQLPYHEKFEEDCKCKCHQETKEIKGCVVKEGSPETEHYFEDDKNGSCACGKYKATPNKNIECTHELEERSRFIGNKDGEDIMTIYFRCNCGKNWKECQQRIFANEPTSNKNIEGWEEIHKFCLDIDCAEGEMEKIEYFIRNLLSAQRSNLVKEIEKYLKPVAKIVTGLQGDYKDYYMLGYTQAKIDFITLINSSK